MFSTSQLLNLLNETSRDEAASSACCCCASKAANLARVSASLGARFRGAWRLDRGSLVWCYLVPFGTTENEEDGLFDDFDGCSDVVEMTCYWLNWCKLDVTRQAHLGFRSSIISLVQTIQASLATVIQFQGQESADFPVFPAQAQASYGWRCTKWLGKPFTTFPNPQKVNAPSFVRSAFAHAQDACHAIESTSASPEESKPWVKLSLFTRSQGTFRWFFHGEHNLFERNPPHFVSPLHLVCLKSRGQKIYI